MKEIGRWIEFTPPIRLINIRIYSFNLHDYTAFESVGRMHVSFHPYLQRHATVLFSSFKDRVDLVVVAFLIVELQYLADESHKSNPIL